MPAPFTPAGFNRKAEHRQDGQVIRISLPTFLPYFPLSPYSASLYHAAHGHPAEVIHSRKPHIDSS